jgi:hypothetical protein
MRCGSLRIVAACVLALAAVPAWAETPERPKTYALVSAVGDQIAIIRARRNTGSHFEGYVRSTVAARDGVVDLAILRGMDQAIERREPQSTRVFLRLSAGQLDDVPPERREQAAMQRLREQLEAMPQRRDWDEIVVITPHFRLLEIQGLPSKVQGVGIYFNNLANDADQTLSQSGAQSEAPGNAPGGERVVGLDGKPAGRSWRYVALFSYTKVWFLDAKTLQVTHSEPWIVNQKIYDPQSTALDVGKMFTPEELVKSFETFVERTANHAVTPLRPTVEPGQPRLIDPEPARPAPPPASRR